MINLTGLRDYLADRIATDDVTVYPAGVSDGPFVLPALIIGQPEVTFAVQPCLDRYSLPVAVVVARGVSDRETQARLESVWTDTAELARLLFDSDAQLGGLVAAVRLVDARFGLFGIQGQEYPAQHLSIEIFA